jgi:hypothetical protein
MIKVKNPEIVLLPNPNNCPADKDHYTIKRK